MIETFSMPFPRQTSKKQRKVYVYLPEGFEPDAAFPVLYMFDGHNVFFDEDATYGKSWGMKEYLEKREPRFANAIIRCARELLKYPDIQKAGWDANYRRETEEKDK